jgi:hypothetical protein
MILATGWVFLIRIATWRAGSTPTILVPADPGPGGSQVARKPGAAGGLEGDSILVEATLRR